MPVRKKAKLRTNSIREFVSNRRPTLLGVKKLMKSIEGMIVSAETRVDIIKGYKMTPKQMIEKGKIPVLFAGVKGANREPVYGCYQMSSVLCTALKEMGLRPKMTRYFISGTPHSTVFFRLNGKLYEADPFYNSQIHLVDKFRMDQIKELRKIK